jgi:cytoskeletal protein RodZ
MQSTPDPGTLPQMGAPVAQSAPSPAFPAQPMSNQPLVSGPAAPVASANQPKSSKKLIILLSAIVGGLVIIGVGVWLLFMFVLNGGTIKNVDELKAALEGNKAMNCTISVASSDTQLLMQADNGWKNVRIAEINPDSRFETIYLRKGDGYEMYDWTVGKKTGHKDSVSVSEVTDVRDANSVVPSGAAVDCKPNNQADFSLPKDVTFS